MCDKEKVGLEELEPMAIFGFDGLIANGLHIHPDRMHIIFPLGNKVSIMNMATYKQQFLCGHTNTISNIDVSKSGALIASGQINHIGFRAYVIIWDWATKSEKVRHELHKVRIEALCFTANEACLITLGGRDDRMLIVWDMAQNSAICGARATTEITGDGKRLRCLGRRGSDFFSAGENNIRLWTINKDAGKVSVDDVIVGKLRREITGMCIDSIDETMFAGTMSGDVLKIRLNCHHDPAVLQRERSPLLLGCFGRHNPKKAPGKDCEKYTNGVRDLIIVPNDRMLVGAGDGTVELVEERKVQFKDYPSPTVPALKLLKRCKVNGAISSIKLLDAGTALIGTEACEIYRLNIFTFDLTLMITCNTSTVYDIAFPYNFSLVFATASYQSLRIWSTVAKQELLRIVVPNFSAASIVFSYDGKSIVSAWNDGVIRAFTPLTGKLIYAIPHAHNKGCSALAISKCGRMLISGGVEGQLRVWKIEPTRQSLLAVLKEHTSSINNVCINPFSTEVVSASTDGTCIIWDLRRMSRKHVLYANTQFTCAEYFPSGVQVLATGTDRRVSYWEAYDASLVRDVEASPKGSINSLSLNVSGENFVTGGSDQIVKLWDYQLGTPICAGYGHAAVIVTCKYSPCGKMLVSGSADGAVIIWAVPEKYWPKNKDVFSDASKKPSNEDAKSIKSTNSSGAARCGSTSSIRKEASIENVQQLESSRSNKSGTIMECPEVDLNVPTDVNEQCVFQGCGADGDGV